MSRHNYSKMIGRAVSKIQANAREHDGTNLQEGGNSGEITALYSRSMLTSTTFKFPLFSSTPKSRPVQRGG